MRARAPARWFADPDPVGTVGGHIAETPGIGNVCGLDLVQSDGHVGSSGRSRPWLWHHRAFPGSRGRAGIAVAITLRAGVTPVSETVVPRSFSEAAAALARGGLRQERPSAWSAAGTKLGWGGATPPRALASCDDAPGPASSSTTTASSRRSTPARHWSAHRRSWAEAS